MLVVAFQLIVPSPRLYCTMTTPSLKRIAGLLLIVFVVAAGCRRKDNDDNANVTPVITAEVQQLNSSTDESSVQSELDDATNSVEAYMDENDGALRRTDGTNNFFGSWRCGGGVTIDTSMVGGFALVFNNSSCGTRVRNGRIEVKLTSGTRWTDRNAVLETRYVNYTVTRPVHGTNRTISINGYHKIENVNGGRVIFATSTNAIVHKVRGVIAVDLDNGGARQWQVYRRVTYTTNSNGLNVSIAGDTTIGNLSNLLILGINRYDQQFSVRLTSPLVSNANCGFWKPVSGERLHTTTSSNQIIVKMGLNSAGTAVAPGACATHYSIEPGAQNAIRWTKHVIAY